MKQKFETKPVFRYRMTKIRNVFHSKKFRCCLCVVRKLLICNLGIQFQEKIIEVGELASDKGTGQDNKVQLWVADNDSDVEILVDDDIGEGTGQNRIVECDFELDNCDSDVEIIVDDNGIEEPKLPNNLQFGSISTNDVDLSASGK